MLSVLNSIDGHRPRRALGLARALMLVGFLAAACLAVPASAGAQVTTTAINDDNLPVGTVINQYPSSNPEMVFGPPSQFGFQSGSPGDGVVSSYVCNAPTVEPDSPTNTPPNALGLGFCGDQEFPNHGVFAALTNSADHVSAYVGSSVTSGETFELDAYDANRHLLASFPITADGTGITTPINIVQQGTYTIAYVALWTKALGGGTNQFAMDDFVVEAGAGSPSITLTAPSGGFEMLPGGIAQRQVSILRHDGSTGNVGLSVTGLPTGVHATFAENPLTGSDTTTTLTLTADQTAPITTSTATLTATPSATAGPKGDSVPISVRVDRPFAVSAGPQSISLSPCETSQEITAVTDLAPEFTGTPVNLALSTIGDTSDISSISLAKPTLNNPGDFGQPGVDPPDQNSQTLTLTRDAAQSPATSFQIQITPSSGQVTEPPATVTVNRAPVQVTSVTPSYATTPQGLRPGTEVTITGSGFCPGTQVQFGNAKASATPDSITDNGTKMTVQTPPLATTGRLTVTSAGQTATSPNVVPVDNYRDRFGYQFANYTPQLTLGDMVGAFGYSQVVLGQVCAGNACTNVYNPWAETVLAAAAIFLGGGNGGDCVGFSLSSARFANGSSIEPATAFPNWTALGFPEGYGPSSFDAFGLDTSSGPSAELTDFLNSMALQQFSNEFLSSWLTEVMRHKAEGGSAGDDAYQEIRTILSAGHYPLVTLMQGQVGHAVVAYNVEGAPPNWYIDVYDPNQPFTASELAPDGVAHATKVAGDPDLVATSRIHVGLDGNWSQTSTPTHGDMSGLAVVDPAAVPERYPTLLDPGLGVTALSWIVFGSANPLDLTGRTTSGVPPTTITQVADGAGHTLYNPDGTLNSNPATSLDGMPYAPLGAGTSGTAAGAQPPQMIVAGPKTAALHVTVADNQAGSDTHTVLGNSVLAEFSTQASAGARDDLTVAGDQASFATTTQSKPLTLLLAGAASGSDVVAQLTTTSFQGGSDTLSFTNNRTDIQFVHHGAATTYTLRLSQGDPNHPTKTLVSGPLTVTDGQTVTIPAFAPAATPQAQQHFAYLDILDNIQDVWHGSDGWHLQQITNRTGGPSVPGEPIAVPGATAQAGVPLVASVYNNQRHFTYTDANGNLQDVYYDGGQWHLQQINNAGGNGASVAGESIAAPAATAAATGPSGVAWPQRGPLFVSVYNNQQHFDYVDSRGNVQDVFYDGSHWHVQQINNAGGAGPSVPGETIASSAATAAASGDLFVSVYHNEQHFTYQAGAGNLQDVWYDGSQWHLQQINNAGGAGASVPGEAIAAPAATAAAIAAGGGEGQFVVSVYNNEQHFAYRDGYGNVQDVWYDGSQWHLQQITNAGGKGASMPGESIVSPAATAPATGKLFVSIYNNEQHFAYMDGNGNVQDVWWDGNANRWNRQQITNAGGKGASVPGEFIAAPVATAAASGHLVVSVDDNEQHFAYMDGNGNVQDVWYDGRQWHLQQLNNAGGKGASVPGEFVASPGPAEGYLLSASVH